MANSIRHAAVAGMFYPGNPTELHDTVQSMLDHASISIEKLPKAIIVPHAGYIYSGPVAASAYALFREKSQHIKRIVLLGPSHRVALRGLATSHAQFFETPLGQIPLASSIIQQLENFTQVQYLEAAHVEEHSLEVHLPFLQMVVDDFELIPLVVGDASPAEVSEVLRYLWGGEETLIVVSSDLSHYHDYRTARDLDSATTHAIETLNYQNIGYEDACGRNPVSGLLALAQELNLEVHTLDVRNSGDTSGIKDRVVGYGAYALLEPNIQ